LEDNVVEGIFLNTHYKYDRVENMVRLFDCFHGKNLKTIDVQASKEQEANEKLITHEQEDPLKDKDVLASINTSIVNTLITSSIRFIVCLLTNWQPMIISSWIAWQPLGDCFSIDYLAATR
jgi:hypothetical protein